jgi:hypothetical protein
MIKAQQRAYYEALASSDKAGNATSFVTFMLQQLEASLIHFIAEFRPASSRSSGRPAATVAHAWTVQQRTSRRARSHVETT